MNGNYRGLKNYQPCSCMKCHNIKPALANRIRTSIALVAWTVQDRRTHCLHTVMRYYRLNVHMSAGDMECLFRPERLPHLFCCNITKPFLQRHHNPLHKIINTCNVIKLGFFAVLNTEYKPKSLTSSSHYYFFLKFRSEMLYNVCPEKFTFRDTRHHPMG